MPTFDTTPAGVNATSYATAAEFQDYWTLWQMRQPTWIASASTALIQAALEAGTLMLDQSFEWTGLASTIVPPYQALAWPRSGMSDVNGLPIDPLLIPIRLKQALCEFTGQLFDKDRLADDEADKFQVQLARAGDVEVRLQRASLETIESADIWARLKGPEFNWISKGVPEAVRRLLLKSWYLQPTIKRPLIFKSFGRLSGCDCDGIATNTNGGNCDINNVP